MRPRGALSWAKLGVLAVALAFGVAFVANRWDDLTDALADASLSAVAGAFVLGVLGVAAAMPGWRAMLAGLGSPLPVRPAGRVFFLAQLGKYVPGSVWSLVAQAELARELKVPRRVSLAATLLAMAVAVVSGLLVAAVLLPFGGGGGAVRQYWWVVLVVPGLLTALHPRVIETILGRVLPRGERRRYPDRRVMGVAGGWAVLSWLLLGGHAWLLVIAVGGPAGRSFPVAVGGFALAFCLGLLFLPAPAGAGVRDVAFGVAVAGVLDGADVLAVVLVSRVLLAVADGMLAAGWAAAGRRRSGLGGTAGPGDHAGSLARGEPLHVLERRDPHADQNSGDSPGL